MSEAEEMADLFAELDSLECDTPRDVIVHAPFSYPGAKTKSIKHILPRLPRSTVYVEPFGGSAAILLARKPSKLEVFNDRYAGVVAFYRCIKDPELLKKLCEWIDLTIHSREDFIHCRDNWSTTTDLVARAGMWYYMTMYSFAKLGRNFGRTTSTRAYVARLHKYLPLFPQVHERFKDVQVENQDWLQCMRDYDGEDTVFYVDPPYFDSGSSDVYSNTFTRQDHIRLLNLIFELEGFVALSGYHNPIYDRFPWDDMFEWEIFTPIRSGATQSNNHHSAELVKTGRDKTTEVLWIKEFS